MNLRPFSFSILATVLISSCTIIKQEPGLLFDETQFNKNKELWVQNSPKSYKFQYKVDGWRPNMILGFVELKNDNYTAKIYDCPLFDENGEIIEEDYRLLNEDSEYYLKSIDDVFNLIYKKYENSKKMAISDNCYIKYSIEYNPEYGYPTSAVNDINHLDSDYKNLDGDLYSDLKFCIIDFEVLE